jgi:ribosomal protein S18 acetylase RimI-like enzyme
VAEVRPIDAGDLEWMLAALQAVWGGTEVARKGELIDALELDGFVAVDGVDRIGLLTYALRGQELEVVTVHVDRAGEGVGRALMDAARNQATLLGATRMWLTTTNDNVRAYRFYQQWGMDFIALYHDGVARSRALKPSIPLTGTDGIAIRHELEFELLLHGPA